MLSLYIHVPFCIRKCPYCDFYSLPPENHAFEAYTQAICRAMQHSGLEQRKVGTIYFGGGTPVLLPEKRLRTILACADKFFQLDKGVEITIEANPAAGAVPNGFNRVSFGVQSLVDSELKALGRLHTAREAADAIRRCKAEDISADIMLGTPGQTLASLRQTLDGLLALPLTHISAYMLKVEENTPYAVQGIQPADEDALAEMYLFCVGYLAANGFEQYEISNFTKGGHVSRHNLNYWNCGEYLGLGPSAHSFIGGKRFFFPRDIKGFCEAENPLDTAAPDGEGGGFEEYAMLRLRLAAGLDLGGKPHILAKAAPMERHGLLQIKNGVINLTPQGFLLSNTIITELLD